jgi:transcriptional regulator with PAS, ATPase and Fis domain
MAFALHEGRYMLPSCQTEQRSTLIGESPSFRRAIADARKAAASDADILIEAESGTGKELLARLIHQESARRTRPFIAVNCAAVPEALLESELFGHVRGAFTGALTRRAGSFESAEQGTLLLDEIGEMPLALQPKLLRAVQEREIVRLGDSHAHKVDVRVVATTNRSLQQRVESGEFRLDLYYRLNVIPLSLPPLRERPEDIPLLATHFIESFSSGRHFAFSDAFLKALCNHTWPGNVRELANMMRRVAALCINDTIGPEFLDTLQPGTKSCDELSAGLSLRDAERRLLEVTLTATDGNRTRAAEMMGISLRTIRNKIRDYGLPPRRFA